MLDPEQNNTFRDHYLDVPFDLSEVLFLTTANVLDPIPPALRDRMEVLELAGYTEEEKLKIAIEHLIAKQVDQPRPDRRARRVRPTPAIRSVIRSYTREAGVRNLEREIGALCRKVARRRAEGDETRVVITPDVVVEMLGAPTFLDEEIENRTKDPGVAVGLAWTPAGGEVLFVEGVTDAGRRQLTLTGHLGDVMKESARTALSWFRAQRAALQRRSDLLQGCRDPPARAVGRDPEGRPVGRRDDGHGAGVGADRPAGPRRPGHDRRDHALGPRAAGRRHQGEGPGGAPPSASREVILPRQNEKNIKEDLTEELRSELTIHYVVAHRGSAGARADAWRGADPYGPADGRGRDVQEAVQVEAGRSHGWTVRPRLQTLAD